MWLNVFLNLPLSLLLLFTKSRIDMLVFHYCLERFSWRLFITWCFMYFHEWEIYCIINDNFLYKCLFTTFLKVYPPDIMMGCFYFLHKNTSFWRNWESKSIVFSVRHVVLKLILICTKSWYVSSCVLCIFPIPISSWFVVRFMFQEIHNALLYTRVMIYDKLDCSKFCMGSCIWSIGGSKRTQERAWWQWTKTW